MPEVDESTRLLTHNATSEGEADDSPKQAQMPMKQFYECISTISFSFGIYFADFAMTSLGGYLETNYATRIGSALRASDKAIWILLSASITNSIFQPVYALFTKAFRFDKRLLIFGGFLTFAAGLILCFLVTSVGALIASEIPVGIGSAALGWLPELIITSSLSGLYQDMALALRRVGYWRTARDFVKVSGSIAGGPAGSAIADASSSVLRPFVVAFGFVTLASILLAIDLFVRKTFIKSTSAVSTSTSWRAAAKGLWRRFSASSYPQRTLVLVLTMFAYSQMRVQLPPYTKVRAGGKQGAEDWILAEVSSGQIVGMLLNAWLVKPTGYVRWPLLAAILSNILLYIPLASGVIPTQNRFPLPLMMLFGLFYGFVDNCITLSILGDINTDENRDVLFMLFNLAVQLLGNGLGVFVAGTVYDYVARSRLCQAFRNSTASVHCNITIVKRLIQNTSVLQELKSSEEKNAIGSFKTATHWVFVIATIALLIAMIITWSLPEACGTETATRRVADERDAGTR